MDRRQPAESSVCYIVNDLVVLPNPKHGGRTEIRQMCGGLQPDGGWIREGGGLSSPQRPMCCEGQSR